VETLVVDASSLVDWLLKVEPQVRALDDLLTTASLIAPPHIHLEAAHSLKNLGRFFPKPVIEEAFESLTVLKVATLGYSEFAHLAWQHRRNLSFYDAGYLATAMITSSPLVTSDRKLAAVAKDYCDVIEV
jgi:predicted nucleic acid-binding protein